VPYGKGPWVGPVEEGTKAFCACGESSDKPYCDGSHHRLGTGKTPCVYEITEKKNYAICQCGTSRTPPLCDGSHKTLS
jgi:CDGSH-type Zn-finger protein